MTTATEVRWVGDELPGPASRRYKPIKDFAPLVEACAKNPGVWAEAHTYENNRSARRAAANARDAYPSLEWEVTAGDTILHCRFPKEPDDA